MNSTNVTISVNDITKPLVELQTPINNSFHASTSLNVSWMAVDNYDPSLDCNISINSTMGIETTASSGILNSTLITVSEGVNQQVIVTCRDDVPNTNSSLLTMFNVDITPPAVYNITPTTVNEDTIVNYTAVVTDNVGIATCSLYINNVYNGSMTITGNLANRTVILSQPGNYEMNVSCNDSAGNSNESITTVTVIDTTVPEVLLISPINGSEIGSNVVTFICNATDNVGLSNITLKIYNSTGGLLVTNISTVSGISNQSNFVHTLTPGNYIWSCYANDTSDNVNSSWILVNNSFVIKTFSFTGNVKNSSGNNVQGVNVTIYAKAFSPSGPPTVVNVYSTTTDPNGNYTLSNINATSNMVYEVTFIKYELDGNASWVGPTLPPFPAEPFFKAMQDPFGQGTIGPFFNETTVYLQKAGNIKIEAINKSNDNIAFSFMVSDTSLGFPIIEPDFTSQVTSAHVIVPLNRSYSIMFIPQESPPITIDVTPNDYYYTGQTYFVNITANTTLDPVQIYGWVNTTFSSKNGTDMISITNFTNLSVFTFMVMPGNMVPTDAIMPSNLGVFLYEDSNAVDVIDATTGFFNITLPAVNSGLRVLFGLYANNGTTGDTGTEYFAAFYNLTLVYGQTDMNVNLTLYPLAGNFSSSIYGVDQNLSTKFTVFNITDPAQNRSAGEAFSEVETNYCGTTIKWLAQSSTDTGILKLPLLNNTPIILNIYSKNFAPIRKTINASTINSQGKIEVPLYSSKLETPDGTNIKNFIALDFLISNTSCDVINPPASCVILNFSDMQQFNPLKLLLGGAVSVRLRDKVTNITIHYVNVDLLASGPPVEASFDRNASKASSSSTSLEQVWRFGAIGPDIYDRVIIGIPYNSSINESWNYNISIDYLYDEDWNVIWNISENTTLQLPSYYSDFDTAWFNSATNGKSCSKTNSTADCYMDTTNNYFWIRIPHFSGVAPTIIGATSVTTTSVSEEETVVGGGGGSPVHVKKHSWSTIKANTEVSFKVNDYVIGVKEILISPKEDSDDVSITVSHISTRPDETAENRSKVYKYFKIDIENLQNIDYAIIQLMVEKSWLKNNNVNKNNITLYRWDISSNNWEELETKNVKEDLIYVYYNSTLNKFSYFRISEKEKEKIEEVKEEIKEKEEEPKHKEEEVTEEELKEEIIKEKPNKLWFWAGIAAILLILCIVVILISKKNKERENK